jgi:hypothetical protein
MSEEVVGEGFARIEAPLPSLCDGPRYEERGPREVRRLAEAVL